ncbi:hypothetical protein GCM10010448_63080 [Streptomyces glomeratus]|uniref:FAD-binding domain-containing protein n=1 Tax=Streptomyces glomeratus TaxID=284452 RepID=A0ABP6M154_9ACTN
MCLLDVPLPQRRAPGGRLSRRPGLLAGDAAKLSRKLAAVLRGHVRPALLDTYRSERHPVGRLVLRSSGGGVVRPAIARRGAHPLAGRRAPDVALTTGRLYEAQRGAGSC